MAIDTSIYGQLKPVQIESPVNALAQVTQLKNAQNQNRLFDMQVADSERARADDAAVRAAYALEDPVARQNALRTASPKAFREEQKFQLDSQKSQREAEKAQLEGAMQKQAIVAQYAGSAKDQPSWTAAKQALAGMGIDVSQVPDQYDPNTAQTLLQRSLTGVQQLEQQWKAKNYDLDVAKFGETVRNNKTQNSIAGGNLRVAQEGLGLRRQEIANGRIPSGYRAAANGTLEPIPGGPAEKDKAPTEFQGKSATFGARAEQSDKIISGLEGQYSPAKIGAKQAAGRIGLEGAANLLLPKEEQKAEQAMRDFVNAVLRQESGAAISESEFENAKRQYFPQTGDSKAVIAQKAQNRQTAIEGFKKNAGKAAYTASTDSSGSNIDSLLDKYK